MTPIFARGHWHWFDPVIFGLAVGIVYPDRIAEWLGRRYDRTFGASALVLIEAVLIGVLALFTELARGWDSRLVWWYPLLAVGMLALCRLIISAIDSLFGFDRW